MAKVGSRTSFAWVLLALTLGAGQAVAGPNAPVRTGPPPAPTHPVLAAHVDSKPGPAKAVLKTVTGPVVPAVRAAFNNRLHYAVDPYLDQIHAEPGGAGVFRSSRPHSVGSSPELAGANAAPEFVGKGLLKDPNPAASKAGYGAYAARGIKVVVDLRHEATDHDRVMATASGLEYVNVKLHDNAIVNPMETLLEAVNAVGRAIGKNQSVVIHCEKGIGRTGLVAAAYAATKHPEWTEADLVKYAEDRGLELIGQRRALQRFWRALLAGDVVETADGFAVAEGREVGSLDSYAERPGVSRASLARRLTGATWNVPATRPYRQTEPRGVLEAMSEAAAKSHGSVEKALTEGNRVLEWPLVNNAEIGKAARLMIEAAEHEVVIETMIFEDSAIVREIKAGIQALAKTRPHVKVYVRVSPRMPPIERHGSYRALVEKVLDSPNVVVATFDPRAEGEGVGAVLGLNVSHSKTVVVDNRKALVTDANLNGMGDRRADNPKGRDWFQTGIVFEGPAAARIREQSATGWEKSVSAVAKLPAAPPAHPGFEDGVKILTLGQKAGAGRDNVAHQAFLAGFKAAAKRAADNRAAGKGPGERILIMTPNLNDKEVFATLAEATEHLPVFVLLSRKYLEMEQEMPGQGGGNERIVAELSKAAKNPRNLHIRWFGTPTERGTDPQSTIGKGFDMSHAKPILVGDTVWMGSRNLDTQSATTSRELDVVVQSRDTAAKFYGMFRSIWQRSPTAFEATPAAAKSGDGELEAALTGKLASQ